MEKVEKGKRGDGKRGKEARFKKKIQKKTDGDEEKTVTVRGRAEKIVTVMGRTGERKPNRQTDREGLKS